MSAEAGLAGALVYEQAQRERTAVVESATPGGSPAPNNAQYVVLALDATLTQERVLTGTANQIVVTDNGAGSTVVLSLDSNPIIPGANTPDRVLFTNGAGAVATDSVLKYSTTTNLLDVALGYLQVSQKASVSGVPVWLVRLVGAINSGITSGTEAPAILIDLSAQQTWTTNVPTTQRAVVFTAPNYDSTVLSAGANAATLAIENEPGFGPTSVYSHVWALWVQAGATGLGGGLSVGNLAALTGQPTTGQIRSSALTATRVVFVGASNDLTDDADFTFDGAQLALAVQGATGGLLVGTDVQWYRSAANTWRTPDAVVIDSTLTVSTLAAGATDTVVTHSTGLLQTRSIDSRVWGSTLVDGSGAVAQVTYWSDANTITGDASLTYAPAAGLIGNDVGGATADLRWEGDTATNLLFVDVSLDAFQIGTTVAGALADYRSTSVVYNEPGNDVDFRWETDNASTFLVFDGSLDSATFTPTSTRASAAGTTWNAVNVAATTLTLTGNTNITTATGVNLVTIAAPTLSAASALTISAAATLYSAGPPAGGGAGPVTITQPISAWVETGVVVLGNPSIVTTLRHLNINGGSVALSSIELRSTQASGAATGCGIFMLVDDGADLADGDRFGFFSWGAQDGGGTDRNSVAIAGFADGAWTAGSSTPGLLSFETTAPSSITRTRKLALTGDGRLYGSALHNNSGSVTGATNQYIASGTYTPTLTNTTNVAASTAYECQWMRVGNVVTVSGKIDIDPTAAGNTVLGLSLPIASNLGAAEDLAGVGFNPATAGEGLAILGDAVNDRATLQFIAIAAALGNLSYYFTFTYEVI